MDYGVIVVPRGLMERLRRVARSLGLSIKAYLDLVSRLAIEEAGGYASPAYYVFLREGPLSRARRLLILYPMSAWREAQERLDTCIERCYRIEKRLWERLAELERENHRLRAALHELEARLAGTAPDCARYTAWLAAHGLLHLMAKWLRGEDDEVKQYITGDDAYTMAIRCKDEVTRMAERIEAEPQPRKAYYII